MSLRELQKKEPVKGFKMCMSELTHEKLRFIARKNNMTMTEALKLMIEFHYNEAKDEK